MKAIITKYLGRTQNKPSCIKVSAEGVKSITYSKGQLEDQLLAFKPVVDADDLHRHAALLFRDANKWTHEGGNPEGAVLNLASGQINADVHVHCFIPVEDVSEQGFLKGEALVVAQAKILIENSPPPETGQPIVSLYHFTLLKSAVEQVNA